MSATTLSALCGRVRPELASLGDAGGPLLGLLAVVERAGSGRSADVLADPGFALDVLTLAGADGALVGRVLDFLRTRGGEVARSAIEVSSSVPRLADAVASYQAGGLALMDNGTVRTYRTWVRRLVERFPDTDPRQMTAGDLTDLIAHHVVEARRSAGGNRRAGLCAQEHAVHAYRHMWSYFVQKGWAYENVAKQLTKPPRPEPLRRDIRREEAVLLRHLALSTSRDPLLDELTLTIPERLGLRSVELRRLRLCDLDLDQRVMVVRGKLDKERTMPLPPRLAELLLRYVEDRRPAGMSLEAWLASEELLLRRSPTLRSPLGRPSGRRRIEGLWVRLRGLASDVFARGDISPHSYRHAVGTFVDQNYDRAVTRAILGHTSKNSVTDIYVHVPLERRAEALRAYEEHVLAVEPTPYLEPVLA
jgi:integrase